MKVSAKGQVTIPKGIRDKLGILPGTEVEFHIEGNGARIVPVAATGQRGRALVEKLRGRGTVRMTTDEIMKLTRGR